MRISKLYILIMVFGSLIPKELIAQDSLVQKLSGWRFSVLQESAFEGHEIIDSIYSGEVEVEVFADSALKRLRFVKILAGTLVQKSMNSWVYGCCRENDKTLPSEFLRLIPNLEKDIAMVKTKFISGCPDKTEFVKTYELKYKVK